MNWVQPDLFELLKPEQPATQICGHTVRFTNRMITKAKPVDIKCVPSLMHLTQHQRNQDRWTVMRFACTCGFTTTLASKFARHNGLKP